MLIQMCLEMVKQMKIISLNIRSLLRLETSSIDSHFLVAYTYRYYVIVEYLHFAQKRICFYETCLAFC